MCANGSACVYNSHKLLFQRSVGAVVYLSMGILRMGAWCTLALFQYTARTLVELYVQYR